MPPPQPISTHINRSRRRVQHVGANIQNLRPDTHNPALAAFNGHNAFNVATTPDGAHAFTKKSNSA